MLDFVLRAWTRAHYKTIEVAVVFGVGLHVGLSLAQVEDVSFTIFVCVD